MRAVGLPFVYQRCHWKIHHLEFSTSDFPIKLSIWNGLSIAIFDYRTVFAYPPLDYRTVPAYPPLSH